MSVREFFHTRGGTYGALGLAAVTLIFVAFSIRGAFGVSSAGAASRDRLFICSETGKTFRHAVGAGEAIPVLSPYTGERTGYQPQLCYWTAEGRMKAEPTAVYVGASDEGFEPTFCPDCGRLVLPGAPRPEPGDAPPPTRAQYEQHWQSLAGSGR